MARIKGAVNAHKKRRKIMKLAKGYYGSKSKQYRAASGQVRRSLRYAYIGRNEAVRQAQIDRAIQEQADTVLLPTESLRYYYFWGRNPFCQVPWGVEYRQFYGLPEDIELVFLPHGSADCWPDVPPEMLEQAQHFP